MSQEMLPDISLQQYFKKFKYKKLQINRILGDNKVLKNEKILAKVSEKTYKIDYRRYKLFSNKTKKFLLL